jgi:hypothetical protein
MNALERKKIPTHNLNFFATINFYNSTNMIHFISEVAGSC